MQVSSSSSTNNVGLDLQALTLPQDRGTVLIVSERQIDARRVAQLLENSGFYSRWVNDLGQMRECCAENARSAEPFVGTVLCHRRLSSVRKMYSLPEELPGERVIVLSDCDAENTVVSMLESGAHHFFCINESEGILQARLEAAFRCHQGEQEQCVSFGDIQFDVQKRRVTRAGALIDLSPKEYELAYYLFSNKDRVVGNSELMTSIWSLPPSMDTRRIDTAACRLRKKLQLKLHNGWELKRLRSVGYKLVEGRGQEARADYFPSRLTVVPA